MSANVLGQACAFRLAEVDAAAASSVSGQCMDSLSNYRCAKERIQ